MRVDNHVVPPQNVLSVTNREVVFLAPAQETSPVHSAVTVEFGGMMSNTDVTLEYVQSVPEITSVSPDSASPVLKSRVILDGSNFA